MGTFDSTFDATFEHPEIITNASVVNSPQSIQSQAKALIEVTGVLTNGAQQVAVEVAVPVKASVFAVNNPQLISSVASTSTESVSTVKIKSPITENVHFNSYIGKEISIDSLINDPVIDSYIESDVYTDSLISDIVEIKSLM